MSSHSQLVGGSTAKRRIACPASLQESLKAPPGSSSVYADHGSACHAAMEHWLRNPDDDPVGMIFHDIAITQEDVDTLLEPAWNAFVELQEAYGGGFKVTHLEKQVQFPGLPGAFGTVDTILQSPTHFMIADWKFGRGVKVDIEEDGERNAQLLFYLAGCRKLAKRRTMVVAIIQPTFEPHLSHAVVTAKELDAFEKKLHDAIALALSHNPVHVRGDHCMFAPCRITCPLFCGPLLDLSALGKPPTNLPANDDWGVWLAAAKRLVDNALMYQREIDNALLEHLKGGGRAPGFALKPAVKNRKWLDDTAVVAKALKKLGFPDEKIWQPPKLQTFLVVDATAKKLRVEIPDHLRPRPESNDLVLTYAEDPAAIDTRNIAAEFSTALKQLSYQR